MKKKNRKALKVGLWPTKSHKKEIKALGVDYRVMQNHYICHNCKEFFPEISTDYICLKCENRFKLDDARWNSSVNYKVVNMQ